MKRAAAAVLAVLVSAGVAHADSYMFRYKPGLVGVSMPAPTPPEEADPRDYDIVASFIAVVGEPGGYLVPLKPGSSVAAWSRTSGSLPAGMTLDPASGTISGTPSGRGKTTASLSGVSADGAEVTKALVDFTVLEGVPGEGKLDLYALRRGPDRGELLR